MQMLSEKAEPQALQGLHAPRSTSLGLCSGEDVRCPVFAGTGLAHFLLPCPENAWT